LDTIDRSHILGRRRKLQANLDEEVWMATTVDTQELETKVRDMYCHVARQPHGQYHFEMGRSLAERLGYATELLDSLPEGAIESFAGVGYFFDLANLEEGESVLDLGSGSGMDAFAAAMQVGEEGRVVGVDMTSDQIEKSTHLRDQAGFGQVEFRESHIEKLPVEDASFDAVISNGVINLCPEKPSVFAEAARVLRPGGRLAIADIVSEQQLKDTIVCDADLWASCIGGAAQQDAYRETIEGVGLRIEKIRGNPYRFISERARDACDKYGVKSVSLLAMKDGGS
jgi:arsenite methyltransferase